MSAHCCEHETPKPTEILDLPRYRRILWIALLANAAMFLLEIAASFGSDSLSLLADAIDFGGDALNYAVSLAVLASALAWRARAAMLKAVSMMSFGVFVLAQALVVLWSGTTPDATTMGAVAVLALGADLITHLPWAKHFLHMNAVNGLIGAPIVLWVLLRQKHMRGLAS